MAMHAAARAIPAVVMNRLVYAGETSAMKVSYADAPVPREAMTFLLVTAAIAALPLALLSFKAVILGTLFGAALGALLARSAKRLIGGYTGDVLGAIEQLFEIGFLLGVAAAFR
ncbi:MAG: adenosylcobinamide-GDP ribazoletransferase [Hyphomicrobiales bacterium]|nr:adenosylcobinamide-GDP ribazoletransferase [Hyphomicrobiales bacterium]